MGRSLPLPPTLTDEALDEFIEIMDAKNPDHGMTREELADSARRLLRLVQLTYKPIPKNKADKL